RESLQSLRPSVSRVFELKCHFRARPLKVSSYAGRYTFHKSDLSPITMKSPLVGQPLVLLCLALESPGQQAQPATASNVNAARPATFFISSKPYTRWWWFASTITKEDIDTQLEWLRDNNFGGVEIAWIYPPQPKVWAKLFNQLSPEEKERKLQAPK